MSTIARRDFLRNTLVSIPMASLIASQPLAQTPLTDPKKPPLCVFSKHLQFLDYSALAKFCKEAGLDGIDLTVRPGGHVAPEKVTQDLPAAVEAIRAEGLDVPMITTRYLKVEGDEVLAVMETARRCGIPYLRIGNHNYKRTDSIQEQLAVFTEEVRGLTRLAEELDITLGYHNHSGEDNVGAPLWDTYQMYVAIGSDHLGANFDVGHATVEGPYGNWGITSRLLAPWVRMVAVKDFVFDGRKPRWVPLGEGVVDTAAFLRLFRKEANFSGPVSLHFEYKIKSHDAMLEEVRKAVQYMRQSVYPNI